MPCLYYINYIPIVDPMPDTLSDGRIITMNREGKLMLKPDFEGIQARPVCKKILSFKPGI